MTVVTAEPAGRVPDHESAEELAAAEKVGFKIVDQPVIGRSRAVLLQKAPHAA